MLDYDRQAMNSADCSPHLTSPEGEGQIALAA